MSSSLHVEVVQKIQSRVNVEYTKDLVRTYLNNFAFLNTRATINVDELEENSEIKNHVQSITFCDVDHGIELPVSGIDFIFHIFKLYTFGVLTETMTDITSGNEFAAADIWALPAQDFHGLWESLIYESRLKEDTVRFVETAFDFADRGVDPKVVSWNRVVLLHGPPGTGKTSLCRALAQKLAIRFKDRFPRTLLIEINGHGLFSKWLGESGKLVARLFNRVTEIVEDRRMLVCVLLDEVESLAYARRAALAGHEPSDSIRAVNALITQLDRLRKHPNVFVLTTSNVTGAIDVAFVDRADIKRLVGPPSERVAYEILRGCCWELITRGVVALREPLFTLRMLEATHFAESFASAASLGLWEVAREAAASRVSARALRRLPFLARALISGSYPRLIHFVQALQLALRNHLADAAELLRDNPVQPSV